MYVYVYANNLMRYSIKYYTLAVGWSISFKGGNLGVILD
jgi:hypothetical protein